MGVNQGPEGNEDVVYDDLGVLDGPILVFGGPYSNLQATMALFERATSLGIPASNLICTGDVVAYCADPVETVAATRDSGCAVVAGNCEKQLAANALDCGCGFDEGTTCDLLSAGWYGLANAAVGAQDRAWMAQCPDIVTFRHQGARYAVIHGGVRDVARFIWSSSPESVLTAEWCALEDIVGPVDHIFAGHSGIPFERKTSRGRWINAGVIGMPPHDGAEQTRYAVLDGGEVLFHRLEYVVDGAVAAMQAAGLVQGYDTGLRRGYWPSEDVLPEELRVPSLASG